MIVIEMKIRLTDVTEETGSCLTESGKSSGTMNHGIGPQPKP